ncbi:SDR family oxidoreductase [Saccharopolyspora sp. 5N102]|uniref:SDR family oxidoreductase n=1 Tax=Saccharopolyspora sp. 5N102 TaxID=3375155 RepID=UPI00379248E0
MINEKILVIGASGKVGRQAVTLLQNAGAEVRAMVRNPAAAKLPDATEVVRGDLTDLPSLHSALDGIDSAFLIWPMASVPADPAVVEAIEEHARRIVFLSSAAVRDDVAEQVGPIAGFHHAVEHQIERSGLEWTFLRPYAFASNTLAWTPEIRRGDVVRGAFGAASMTLIHEHDIASVAAHVLTNGGFSRTRHTLTGPELITQAEQVRTIGEVLCRPLRWEEITPEEALPKMFPGMPTSVAESALDGYAEMVRRPGPISSAVPDITGLPARTFRQWVADHAEDFR